jgi:hypothetical protein
MKIRNPFAASLFLLPFAFVGGLSSQDEPASQKQVTGILHQLYEAEKRKDLNFVLSHLSDDFVEVAGDGNVYHRSDIEVASSDVTLKDYKLSDCIFKLSRGRITSAFGLRDSQLHELLPRFVGRWDHADRRLSSRVPCTHGKGASKALLLAEPQKWAACRPHTPRRYPA